MGPLSDLPFLGPILFQHNVLVYLALAAAVALTYLLKRTTWGLATRATGENPGAAHAAGLNVTRLRVLAVLVGGAFAGAGGAFLSTAQLSGFVENMIAGRAFMAIACVFFGRRHPVGVVAVALGFGIAEVAQIRLRALHPGVLYQFFAMLPYLVSVMALVATRGSARVPAALGVNFQPPH